MGMVVRSLATIRNANNLMQKRGIAAQGFVWAFGMLSQIHRIPFDPQLLLRQFPPPYTLASLQQALQSMGLRVTFKKSPLHKLPDAVLPCMAVLNVEEGEDSGLALILKSDGERLLVLEPGQQAPQSIALEEFSRRFAGHILLARKQAEEVADPDATPKQFGFRWFIPELLKYRKIWREILLASFAIQLVGLAVPVCTQIVIDKVVVHHTVSTLVVIGVALFVFLVFNAAMGWVRQYLVLHTGNRIDATLGHKVFSHLLDLPLRYYQNRPTGVVVARIHGVETIREFLAGGLVTLLLDFPFLIVFLAIMFWYSWQLTLIALAALAVISILSFAVTPLIRERLNRQFMIGARNQAFLTEYISGMETVKSLQMEPQLKQRFGNYLSDYLGAGFQSRNLSNTYNTAANAIDQIQTLAILCVGAWLVMHNTNFTVGMLVAFQMFSGRLSGPVLRLVGLWQEFQQADIAVKRLGDVMNAPIEPYSLIPKRANSPSPLAEEGRGEGESAGIAIDSLAFRYSEEHPWLYRNLTFGIRPGHCVVLMGPSGCGKSTLAKLLLGFHHPQEGQIKLDGHDIRHLAANELRNHFGVVPQETVLFSGTIYDNLILANPHAGFEQIVHACRLAEIHESIEKLPQGYQTEIGEHGAGLSGGQKQRLAIARALLKQPRFLIFDEATSSLDSHTAEHFAKTINKLKGQVGMLFITHQLPKGLHVDEAVLLGKETVGASDHEKQQQE